MLSIDDRGPPPICPQNFNAAGYIVAAGRQTPDKVAMAVLGPYRAERWSFERVRLRIGAAQTWLLSQGIAPGDRLLLRLANTPDVPVAFLGAIAAGILPVPTSASLTRSEVNSLADGLTPSAILAAPGITAPDGPFKRLNVADMQAAPDAEPDPVPGDPNRPAYIMTTSGTSGTPRLVHHAHRAIWARHLMRDGWTDMTPDDRVMHAGAFNWTYTLGTGLLDPWSVGATALIPAEGGDASLLPLLMQRHDATIFAAVPGVFRKLLRRPLTHLPKLRHALSAGEKLAEPIRDGWRDATGTEIHEAFGQTEISTFLSGSPARLAPAGTLGYVQPGRRLAILDDTGVVQRGIAGDIAVASDDPGLCLCAPQDAWVRTGDQGIMQDDGAVVYLGRSDDILTAGGYRVSPLEIETAMSDMPGLTGLAAVDVRLTGDTVVIGAFYTAERDLSEDHLRDHAAQRLADYKRPRVWTRLDALPRNVNGKLLRRALRDAKGKTP